ncbi:MAG: thioredoxin family protein [Planctomycetaceae bacterium]|nr:thioredoxin family protein [Planctomycetaceae bacterium]
MKQYFFVLIFCVGVCFLAGCDSKISEVSQDQSVASTESSADESSFSDENVSVPQIIDLTSETFDSFIQSEEKVLVDFWAPWCPPCRKQGELLHEWSEAGKLPASARVGKVNVDEQSKLANQFNIQSIPALFIFQKGEIIQQFMGLQDEETLVNALQ